MFADNTIQVTYRINKDVPYVCHNSYYFFLHGRTQIFRIIGSLITAELPIYIFIEYKKTKLGKKG